MLAVVQGTKLTLYTGLVAITVFMGCEAFVLAFFFGDADPHRTFLLALLPPLLVLLVGLRQVRRLHERERVLTEKAAKAEQVARDLKWEASHDALTRLINRREFNNRASSLCRQAEMARARHVVMFLDLDQFKLVNDTCGHAAGDALLRQLPSKLQACLGPNDTLARIGGDEFGVLLPGASLERGEEVAEALSRAVRDFRFFWHGRLFEVGVSIGVVSITREHSHLQTVFHAADTACYIAKRNGRNQIKVMDSSAEELRENKKHANCAYEIPEAIRENRLELYVQEIRAANELDGATSHYEVLVRMRARDGRLIYPAQFIPVAERYGLALDVDRWVVNSALAWMASNPPINGYRGPGGKTAAGCRFSINLSGQSLSNEAFLGEVLGLFRQYDVDPGLVTFEVTETAVISNLATARRFIKRLKAIGCRFALDDFGSGMSSFAYLQQLDVDYVKIDGSLVSRVARGGLENVMIVAIIQIARYMKACTVAEYVEDDLTEKVLRDAGIDYMQGYLLHRPMPIKLLNGFAPANEEIRQRQLKLVVG